ncbi:MAG: tetratricopeptide repeat protein [Alphaproteobacteria bacterium]|nr:tetratricopeptide repeat protein [Alphaproteobacteria bacterium]
MLLLLTFAFGQDDIWGELWDDVPAAPLDERTAEAVAKLKVTVDGAWRSGPDVVVDLTVAKLDRMLDPATLQLDGTAARGSECLTRDGAWEYCWVDEGRRRVRVVFSSPAEPGGRTLTWYGTEIAKIEPKPNGAPEFVPIDQERQDALDWRVPTSFTVLGTGTLDADEHPARPGRKWAVVHAAYAGAPPSILGSSLRLSADDGGWETTFGPEALVCSTKKGVLGTCDPLPDKGEVHYLFDVPRATTGFQMTFGEATLGEPQTIGDLEVVEVPGALLEGLPKLETPEPMTVHRAWTALDDSGLWLLVDIELEEVGGPRLPLQVFDADVGDLVGYSPILEWFVEDPGETPGDPVGMGQGRFVRIAHAVTNPPLEVVVASYGTPVAELEVAEEGPMLDDSVLGVWLVDNGRLDAALGPLQRAIAADPKDGVAMGALAWAHDRLQNPALAFDWALRALDNGADYRDELYVIAARNGVALERFDEAQAAIERGLEELKGNAVLQVQLGAVHQAKGDLLGAEHWLLRAARHEGSGEAWSRLSEVMALQDQRSHAALALLNARLLGPYLYDAEEQRARLVEWVTPKATWTGGTAVRGPLFAVTPLRVSSSELPVAAAQVEYLMLAYASAAAAGREDQRLRSDLWYTSGTALIERIVAADLTEAAAWRAVSYPGEWPVRLNVAVERVDRLVMEHNAQMQH